MLEIRGITISVNYGPLLEITLWRNMRHLSECLVITSPEDEHTQRVARAIPGVRLHVTDAFTRHGARFNKGLAFEEGFDVLVRHGRLLIWDADILFPESLALSSWRNGYLHGARRRLLEDPLVWSPTLDWKALPVVRDGGPIGFFQAFDADDPAIVSRRPWYDVSFAHAGGGDAYFMTHWAKGRHCVLPIDVLHLGPNDRNWFGVDPVGRDLMAAFVVRNGWHRAAVKADWTAVTRVGEVVERVEVPGYEPTGFELPFVRRSRQANLHRIQPHVPSLD